MKEWVNTLGKRQELPTFENLAKDKEQLQRFTLMVESTLTRDGADLHEDSSDLSVRTAITPVTDRVISAENRPHVLSALRKLHLSFRTDRPQAGSRPETPLTLTAEERRALAPFFEKFQRATETLKAFQGNERFTDVELKAIVNWAAMHSPELSGLLAQVGNKPEFFVRAIKSMAYTADPAIFNDLRGRLEAARNIAQSDTALVQRINALGEKYGIATRDLLDVINNAPNPTAAGRGLQALIKPTLQGSRIQNWLSGPKAWLAVREIHGKLRPPGFSSIRFYRRRDALRATALGVEGGDLSRNGVAETLLTLISGRTEEDGRTGEGLLSAAFESELAGQKGSPDYDDARNGIRGAKDKMRGLTPDSVATNLNDPEYRRRLDITDDIWNDRNHIDPTYNTSNLIAEMCAEDYSRSTMRDSGIDSGKGLWHGLWSGIITAFKGLFYTEKDLKGLSDKIKTIA